MKQFRILISPLILIILLISISCKGDATDRRKTGDSPKTSPSPTLLKTDDDFSTFNADYYETRDIYNVISMLNPISGSALQKKAIQQREDGKYQESIATLEEAIIAYPNKASLWFSKGKTYLYMGEIKKAEECLQKSVQLKPDPETWYFTGVLKAYAGKHKEAVQCFDKSIDMKPNPYAWYSKGVTYDDTGKENEALKCFNKCLEFNKNYPAVWYAKGVVLLQLNRYDEARVNFNRAKELGYRRAEKALEALSKKGL